MKREYLDEYHIEQLLKVILPKTPPSSHLVSVFKGHGGATIQGGDASQELAPVQFRYLREHDLVERIASNWMNDTWKFTEKARPMMKGGK